MRALSQISKEIMDVLFYGDELGMTCGQIAARCGYQTKNLRQIIYRLRGDGLLICRVEDGRYFYMLSETGVEVQQAAPRNKGVSFKRWINLVRQGIDDRGRETRVKRAKTPSVAEIREPNKPDIEAWIDARRELGLA